MSLSHAVAAVILAAIAAGCIKRATIEFENRTGTDATVRTEDKNECTAPAGGRCRVWFHSHLVVVTGDMTLAYDLPPITGDRTELDKWEAAEGFMDRIVRLRFDTDQRLTLVPGASTTTAAGVTNQPPGYPVVARWGGRETRR